MLPANTTPCKIIFFGFPACAFFLARAFFARSALTFFLFFSSDDFGITAFTTHSLRLCENTFLSLITLKASFLIISFALESTLTDSGSEDSVSSPAPVS